MASLASTLTALARPRRAVPIAAVAAAIAGVQASYSGPRAAVVPVAMVATFVVLAPWSWRILRDSWPGLALYVCEAVVVVGTLGVVLPRALDLGPTFLTDLGSLGIAIVLYAVGGWGLGRDIELEDDLAHVRLKAIRTHLDPHFLYNTLNAIAEWCREDPKVAEEATTRLADLLRATLEALELRRWPLAREVALVEDLLALHRIRDPEAFSTELAVDPAVRCEVPPLVIVALVENALKHGPRSGHRGAIVVRVVPAGDGMRCEVENPGAFVERAGGRGLATLRSRLELAYGRHARFSITAAEPNRTRAVLELGT